MANPSDVKFYLVPEVTAGTTPATPAWQYIPYSPGDNVSLMAETATSSVILPGRDSAGSVKVGYRAEGSISNDFYRSTLMDTLLASAHSGTWATNTLVASDVDSSFTVEKSFKEGAVTNYRRVKGCQVSSFSLSCTAGSGTIPASYDVIGLGADHSTTAVPSSTYTPVVMPGVLCGADINNVSIGGLTGVKYAKLDYSVEHSRSAQSVFGSYNAEGIGTEGARTATLALSLLRKNWDAETAFATSNAIVTAVVEFGSGAAGYRLTFKGTASVPEDEDEGASMYAKVTLTAAGSGAITWTKLT